MELTFTNVSYLFLLFLIPLMIFFHFYSIRASRKIAIKFSNFDAIARIKGIDMFSKNIVILTISCIIVALVSFALSGMTLLVNVESSEFSYVIAIDSSESMLANDLNPTRLDVAKDNALAFVESAPFGTKIGVVSFSGNAIVEKKVSSEKSLTSEAIRSIEATEIGGTDISEALVTSINQLLNEEYKSIIILSDGQINTGKIDKALDYANENNVVIHTIGIGTIEGGNTTYGISKLDEDSLKSIAYNTKGEYFNMQNGDSISGAFDSIVKFKEVDVPIKVYNYLLLISLILFILEFVLINTRYRTYP